jgi:alginate O-acetyltransferase complex protein AlgJ
VLAIVPAKTRLYPEHVGDNKPATLHTDLYQQFHAQVNQAGILAPDLLTPLQQAPRQGPGVPAHRHALDADGRRNRRPAVG